MVWWRRLRPKRRRHFPLISHRLQVFSPALAVVMLGLYADTYSDVY